MPPHAGGIAVVIPTLNESELIAAVVAGLPRHVVDRVIVADGGSTDDTIAQARRAGAETIEAGRGYGRACLAGAQAVDDADIIVFMDGDGADDPAAIAGMVAALRSGRYDFVIGSRARGERERGSMASHQILSGLVAGALIGLFYGVRYTDMCAYRAIPTHHLAGARHARIDLRLESRNADAGGARRLARSRTAGGLSPPHRRAVQGRRLVARFAARRDPHHDDLRARRDGAGPARRDVTHRLAKAEAAIEPVPPMPVSIQQK